MACGCEKCAEEEKLLAKMTPELELLLERIGGGMAMTIQEAGMEKVPRGLSPALKETIFAAAVLALAEGYSRSLARERLEPVVRVAMRILATSEHLKAEEEKRRGAAAAAFDAALRGAGVPRAP